MNSRRVAVALSGGVDSSVVAALLLRDGWDAVGVTLVLNAPGAPSAGLRDDGIAEQAARAAAQLGIGHHAIDCAGDFERLVLRPAWGDCLSGRTPNPCMLCNERMKFGVMLDWAIENGCCALATGHYAVIGREGGVATLRRGADRNKDQTYFLAGLGQEQLSRLMFPLGGMDKPAVKKMAAEMGLVSAKSKESQDTCFKAPGMSLAETLRTRFADGAASASQAGQAPGADGAASQAPGADGAEAPKRGFIVGPDGRRLAAHDGIHNFTVGQRRGVGVGTGGKAWVRRLDAASGDVHLTDREDDLLCDEMIVSDISWVSPDPAPPPLPCEVQVRYRSAPVAATLLDASGGSGRVALHSPVRSAAPGQAAAFYSGDMVLGRGWIASAKYSGERG
jgi:tRNA-specific 2-thiouridylase